jgi:Zn-dependent protease with chaperone function
VVSQSKRLGMKEVPEVYIIEDNSQNAFALKHGNKSHVILVDDLVYGALMTKKPKIIDFIIGHELAHHALGHTNTIRGMIRSYFRPLSRLDEFSCDAVAHALVEDPEAAKDSMVMMLVGPHLTKLVNHESFDQQVQEVVENRYSRKGERLLTHPLLLRRYARILDPSLR